MKKLFFAVMTALLAVSVFAAGGSQGGRTGSGVSERTGAKGALPISNKKPVLSIFIAEGINQTTSSYDYKDNVFTRQITDRTGIELKITASTTADSAERLNIMLNTGDYPDIIANTKLDIEYYASQGIIVPLNSYDPMSFPNIKRVFDTYPYMMDKVIGADGKIYALPSYNGCIQCTYSRGRIWFYMPWVRDNNRKVPETLDEFADFLRFVKNTDLNKNGKQDEIPMVFNRNDVGNIIARFAKAYMPWVRPWDGPTGDGLALDNNRKIVEQYRDPAFRETLRYLNGLYKEGLMLPDSFSMTSEQEIAMVRNPEPVAGVVGSSWLNNIALPGSQRFIEYFYLPALKGPSGQRWGTNADERDMVSPAWYVTNKCKDPDLAIALYDYLNSSDCMMALRNGTGPKGVFWDVAQPGTKGQNGQPAAFRQLMAFGTEPTNSGWHDVYVHIIDQSLRDSQQMNNVDQMARYINTMDKSLESTILSDSASYLEYMMYATSQAESRYAIPINVFIPPHQLANTDAARVADINAVLDPFKSQAWVEFITGVRNINGDGDWNAYLAELDRLGSKEMVSIRQKYIK